MTSIQSEPAPVNFNLPTVQGSDTESATELFPEEDVVIDHSTFDQLVGICEDDDDNGEFLRTLIGDYFKQAERTNEDMETAVSNQDFSQLARLGHFLKGSSAALGIIKVKESCEKLENFGQLKDADGTNTITETEAETRIRELLAQVRLENEEAETYLGPYCEDPTALAEE
ncbi:hypothetical protein BG011_008829 [Mortierella polycephala]|uniref:HPt domain-containing protein n=1 Tax=Mortierella polycephala TaxID=41804 RepID=A0A9P6U745_9FUNG|nr:hypothetical protein BG011_008829 [Mortierella polycephala]